MSGRTRKQARDAELALLKAIRDRPGLRIPALSIALRATPSAIFDRARRLEARDGVERDPGKRWYAKGCMPAADVLSPADERLLEMMRGNPGASSGALAALIGHISGGAIAGRCQRLSARGLVVKRADRRWVLAREEEEPDGVSEWIADRPGPADDPKTWVRSISRYVRSEPEGAPARYG